MRMRVTAIAASCSTWRACNDAPGEAGLRLGPLIAAGLRESNCYTPSAMNDELELLRQQKYSEDLERYEAQLLETAALLKLFREQHDGQQPASMAALKLWAQTTISEPIDPYAVLTST